MTDGWDPATYGDRIADVYDDWYGDGVEVDQAAAALAALTGEGRALELGIGTGRLALALSARGVEVHGVDASAAMVERLRAKPGGDRIPVALGDMADVPVEGAFSVVFVAFNTFFNLTDQDAQLRCMTGAAAHLVPGGAFVVEAFVPDTSRFQLQQAVSARTVEPDRVVLQVSRHDALTQTVDSSTIVITEHGVRLFPLRLRYAAPAELDLMARLAGLHLAERWSGWDRAPFTPGSAGHVSVYRASEHATPRRGVRVEDPTHVLPRREGEADTAVT